MRQGSCIINSRFRRCSNESQAFSAKHEKKKIGEIKRIKCHIFVEQ